MQIHIGICDDEPCQIEYLQQIVAGWARDSGQDARVRIFPGAEAFLFVFDADKSFDILLLDIQMKGMDGVTLAHRLREADRRIQLVFITGYPDYIAEGYEVSALHYLLKPVSEQKLRAVLERACERLAESARTVLLPLHEGFVRLSVDELLYAEVFSHDLRLTTLSQTIQPRISLNELEALLGEGFFRCHRSFIVNLRHVRKVTRTSVVLDSGAELPLSRKLYDAANQAFIKNLFS